MDIINHLIKSNKTDEWDYLGKNVQEVISDFGFTYELPEGTDINDKKTRELIESIAIQTYEQTKERRRTSK